VRVGELATCPAKLGDGAVGLGEETGELPVDGQLGRQRWRMEGMVTLWLAAAERALAWAEISGVHYFVELEFERIRIPYITPNFISTQ